MSKVKEVVLLSNSQMLINVKMATLDVILIFMSMMNFMLSSVEPEKSFITSGHV